MTKRPGKKLVPIKNKAGDVVGQMWIYWSNALQKYVTIPE